MSFSAARAIRPQSANGEFAFTDADFATIAKLVRKHAGIVVGPSKRSMVYARLARRLRELGLESFSEYCDLLKDDDGRQEFGAFINAMTTNLTRFFREDHHFDFLAKQVLTPMRGDPDKRLRIWSAGCSSGEEPYSIAMTVREAIPDVARWNARILATDLDTSMLEKGASGRYRLDAGDDIPERLRARYFTCKGSEWIADDQLRNLITFKQLNLLSAWPMKGPFDVIFCRNVMIYFDNPTKIALVRRFAELLKPQGWLIVGHSETLLDQASQFKLHGRTIYRKVGQP